MQEPKLIKYVRTPHLEGSRLQPGDENLSQIPFSAIAGRHLAIEEKCDGANTAVSFGRDGGLLLQSRGHYLAGGWRERHYDLLKQWATVHRDALYAALGSRYIMYGEWMYAKHTVYYDRLPHYFLEFDVLDREAGRFLDTPARRAMLRDLPVASVPVLAEGEFRNKDELLRLLGPSRYISGEHMEHLRQASAKLGLDAERQVRETDPLPTMEGLYIKVEEDGAVADRMKFVRPTFYQAVQSSESHWQDRPIIPNGLAIPMDDLFLPVLPGRSAP